MKGIEATMTRKMDPHEQLHLQLLTSPYTPIVHAAVHALFKSEKGIQRVLELLKTHMTSHKTGDSSVVLDPKVGAKSMALILSTLLSYAQAELLPSPPWPKGNNRPPPAATMGSSLPFVPSPQQVLPTLLVALPKLKAPSEAYSLGIQTFLSFYAWHCLSLSKHPTKESARLQNAATMSEPISASKSTLLTLVETFPACAMELWHQLIDSYFLHPAQHLVSLSSNLPFCRSTSQLALLLTFASSFNLLTLPGNSNSPLPKSSHSKKDRMKADSFPTGRSIYPSREELLSQLLQVYLSLPASDSETPFKHQFTKFWTRVFLSLPPTLKDPFLGRSELLASMAKGLHHSDSQEWVPWVTLFLLHDLLERKDHGHAYGSELRTALTTLLRLRQEETYAPYAALYEIGVAVVAYALLDSALPYPAVIDTLAFLRRHLETSPTHCSIACAAWILPLLQLQVHPVPHIAHLATQLFSALTPTLLSPTRATPAALPRSGVFLSSLGRLLEFHSPVLDLTPQTEHRMVLFPYFFMTEPQRAMHCFETLPPPLFLRHAHHFFLFFLAHLNLASKPILLWLFHAFSRFIATKHPFWVSKVLQVLAMWNKQAVASAWPHVVVRCLKTLLACWQAWSRCWRVFRDAMLYVIDAETLARTSGGPRKKGTEPRVLEEGVVEVLLQALDPTQGGGSDGAIEEELVHVLHRFLKLRQLSTTSRQKAVQACVLLAQNGSVGGLWEVFVSPLAHPPSMSSENTVFESVLTFLPLLDTPARVEACVALMYPFLPLPPLTVTSEVDHELVETTRPKSPLVSTELGAIVLRALAHFPSPSEILPHLVTCTVQEMVAALVSLLRDEHPKDAVWREAVTEFLRYLIHHEVLDLPRSIFTSRNPVVSSASKVKGMPPKKDIHALKDRFLEYCFHAPNMVQGSVQAAYLALSPGHFTFPSSLTALSLTSHAMHRLLHIPLWCEYWRASAAPADFLVPLLEMCAHASTPHEKINLYYACTAYGLTLASRHASATRIAEFFFAWLLYRYLGHKQVVLPDTIPTTLHTFCHTRDPAEIHNDEIQACIVSCLAHLCQWAGEEEEVHAIVDYCFEAIVGDSDWAGFDAAFAICFILANRFSLRATVPAFVPRIQVFLASHLWDARVATKKRVALAMGIAHVRDAQPAALPPGILDAARRASAADALPSDRVCATWVLAHDPEAAPCPAIDWERGTGIPVEDPLLAGAYAVALGIAVARHESTAGHAHAVEAAVRAAARAMQLHTVPVQRKTHAAMHALAALGLDVLGGGGAGRCLTSAMLQAAKKCVDLCMQGDPRLTKAVVPSLAWLLHGWDLEEEDPADPGGAPWLSSTKEPTDYARIDASRYYLPHVLDLLPPSTTVSLVLQAHLLEHVFNFDHPLPSLDWYPLLSTLTQAGYLTQTWTFASLHAASSYSCLDFLLDHLHMQNKPLPVWERVVEGFPVFLAIPSTTPLPTESTPTQQRGRKGQFVIFAEEKKVHALQTLLFALFPAFQRPKDVASQQGLGGAMGPGPNRGEPPPDTHRVALQTQCLKHLTSKAPLACLLESKALQDVFRQLYAETQCTLTMEQIECLVPFFPASAAFVVKTKQDKFLTGYRLLQEVAVGVDEQLTPKQDAHLLQLLRSLLLDHDPRVDPDLYRHAQHVALELLTPVSAPVAKRVDRLLRYLDLLLFLATSAHLERAVHFLQHFLLPFLGTPSTHPVQASLPYAFRRLLDLLSEPNVTKIVKKILALALLPDDPFQWKPMAFHLCAQYRHLDPCKSEWKQWVTFLNHDPEDQALFQLM